MAADKNDDPVDDEALKRRLGELTKALDGKRQETEETARASRKGSNEGIGKAMGTGDYGRRASGLADRQVGGH